MGNAGKKFYKFLNIITLGLIDDFKWLFIIFRRMSKQEPLVDPNKWRMFKHEMKGIRPKDFFNKKFMVWTLVFLFAMAATWMVSAKYYEVQCNNLIIKEYIIPQMGNNLSLEGTFWNLTPANSSKITLGDAIHAVGSNTS